MGKITIKIEGSFGKPDEKEFSANHGGHAYALTRAIGFFSGCRQRFDKTTKITPRESILKRDLGTSREL